MKRLLYFVSNSKNKYEELKQMAEGTSYDIRWYQYSIKELQTDKVEELLRHLLGRTVIWRFLMCMEIPGLAATVCSLT